MPLHLDRLIALVCRELGAVTAEVVAPERPSAEVTEDRELRAFTPDGYVLVATFDAPPPDRDAKQRRLEMLASTFEGIVDEVPRSVRPRADVAVALKDELMQLCSRVDARNAVVIDAQSPVVWGAAETELEGRLAQASRTVVDTVLGLGEVAAIRKGKHVRHFDRDALVPFAVHSFAGIYLLVLVYETPFDEIGAERAMVEALPRIERLVLALPPLDPSPMAGARAIALRPRRR